MNVWAWVCFRSSHVPGPKLHPQHHKIIIIVIIKRTITTKTNRVMKIPDLLKYTWSLRNGCPWEEEGNWTLDSLPFLLFRSLSFSCAFGTWHVTWCEEHRSWEAWVQTSCPHAGEWFIPGSQLGCLKLESSLQLFKPTAWNQSQHSN